MPAPATKSATKPDFSQRERLLSATTRVVGEQGYLTSKVEQIAREARVSCSTFYACFADKRECFLAAHEQIAGAVKRDVERAVAGGHPCEAAHATLAVIVELAEREPLAFQLLSHEALLAGPRAVQQRDGLLAALAETLERAWRGAGAGTPVPDIPAKLMLGGTMRALGMRLRRDGAGEHQPLGELLEWVSAYSVSVQERRWHDPLEQALLAARAPAQAHGAAQPLPLPRGRHRLSPAVVDRVQRERLLFATSAAIRDKGYEGTAVGDIVSAAGVSREVFYEHFANKQEAFAGALKLFFESSVGTAAGAFFTQHESRPEQVWQTAQAMLRFIAARSSFARAAFLEPYAVDPLGIRTDEFLMAFSMFVQDGHPDRPAPHSQLHSAALIGAVLEAIATFVVRECYAQLPQLTPLISYIVLAPRLGAVSAAEFVSVRAAGPKALDTH